MAHSLLTLTPDLFTAICDDLLTPHISLLTLTHGYIDASYDGSFTSTLTPS